MATLENKKKQLARPARETSVSQNAPPAVTGEGRTNGSCTPVVTKSAVRPGDSARVVRSNRPGTTESTIAIHEIDILSTDKSHFSHNTTQIGMAADIDFGFF